MATKLFSKFVSGYRLISGDKLNNLFQGSEQSSPAYTVADGVIARAGGGQANATPLTAMLSRVTVVATAADSVKLPPSKAGANWTVYNSTANALQLFGAGSDTINAAAAAAGVSVGAGKTAELNCFTAGAWFGPIALA